MSKTLSIKPEAFSKDIEYEKPEQPPPTTPTRSPAGTGVCWPIISFTFATALGVSIIGAFLVVSWGFTSGMMVVAIQFSLKIGRASCRERVELWVVALARVELVVVRG